MGMSVKFFCVLSVLLHISLAIVYYQGYIFNRKHNMDRIHDIALQCRMLKGTCYHSLFVFSFCFGTWLNLCSKTLNSVLMRCLA